MNKMLEVANTKVGDFPIWGAVTPMAPAAVCQFLGFGYAGTFVVYLAVVSVIAILVQLDSIDVELQRLNKHMAAEGDGD